MKHLSEYSKEELRSCLIAGEVEIFEDDSLELLRELLNEAIQNGNAPNIEEIELPRGVNQ